MPECGGCHGEYIIPCENSPPIFISRKRCCWNAARIGAISSGFRDTRHGTDRQTDRQTRPTPMRYVFVYGGGSSNRRLYRLVAPSMKTFLVGFIPSISVSIWVMTRSAAADPARVTTLTQHVAGETHPVIFL